MSSLLRSTKFLRYFSGAARTLILNSAKTIENNPLLNSKNVCATQNSLFRDYATSNKKPESLEPLLQRLDSEVRRFGRISKRDIDEIFDEIRAKSDITSSQSLLVIRCCGELVPEELPDQRTLLVKKIWSALTELGVPMDISHYNALLRVYIENEHSFSPAEFLDELEKKGLQPNRVTYQRLMWRYCQEGDVEGATKVLEKMRELALPVSEPVLNALVMGHAFHGDTDGARAVLDTMAGAGLQPSNRTYALLACGYAKKGDIDGVKSVIQLSNEKEIFMSDKDIMDIIESLTLSGYAENVDYFLEKMQKGVGHNQDALNLILRLINHGHENTAKKVMKTMTKSTRLDTKDSNLYQGAFFIKQLLKVKKPTDVVIKICRELKEEGLVPQALLIATETALQQGHIYLAQQLFKELHIDGVEIRQHFYWPLLAAKGKEGDEEGLLQILRVMMTDGITPSGETLRDYVIPFLRKQSSPQEVILKLQVANVPLLRCARNMMVELLESGNIKEAANIATQYRPWGQFALVSRPLIYALSRTKDIESFVTVLQVIGSRPQVPQTDEEANAQDEPEQAEDKGDRHEIGRIVTGAVRTLKDVELCDKLFSLLLSRGISITNQSAQTIGEYLGETMSPLLSEKLSKLTSSDLEISPIQRSQQKNVPRNSAQLETLLSQIKAKGGNVAGLNRQLLSAYIKENEVDKTNQFLKQLESEDYVLTGSTIAQIVEFYSQNDDLAKALQYKDLLSTKEPDFCLNNFKLMKLAYALIRAQRVDEAIELLKSNKQEPDSDNNSFLYNSLCWQTLNHLAEQKDDAKLKEVVETIFGNNFAAPTNSLLGPLVKVHLLKDDIESALNEFERCCTQYRCTPWKGELTKRLILTEDAAKLQRLADLSTQVHGEVNTLHDLVLSLVECGRLRQARRILETPGLHARQNRLQAACQRYVEEGKTECLEGLIEATKELSHIDRSNMFYHLLVSYCKTDDTDKALGLWTLLQEEGEIPNEQFLIYLGKHLKSKNREVPFAMPEPTVTMIPQKKDNAAKVKESPKKEKPPKADTDSKKKVSSELKSKKVYSDMIETLTKAGETAEAMDTTIKVIQNGVYPDARVMKFLLKNLAEEGNVEKITQLGAIVNEDWKRKLTYDNKLTQAKFLSGSGLDHVENLVRSLESAKTDEDLDDIVKLFPRSATLASIVEQPELLAKCQRIVEQVGAKGKLLPANLLWMEYLLQGRQTEADALWKQFLVNADMVVFRRILQEAHIRKAPEFIEKLLESLTSNKKVTPEAVGNAYSRLINIYLSSENFEKAKEVLDKAVSSGITIDNINKTSLVKLKKGLETSGQEFKYIIPATIT